MALRAKVQSLDGMPEAVASEYKPADGGGFVLDVEAADGLRLENVDGLRNTVAATRAERDEAKNALKGLQGVVGDASAETVASWKDAHSRIGSMTDSDKVDAAVKQREEALQKKHEAAMAKKDELLGKRTKQLDHELIDGAALRNMPPGTRSHMILPHVRDSLVVVENGDGRRTVKVKGKVEGQFRMSEKEDSTDDMGVGEFIATLKGDDAWAPAFPGSGATGSGASGSEGGTGSSATGSVHTISREDAKSTTKYRKAKEAADKAGAELQIAPD